jgi:hypothetical protein
VARRRGCLGGGLHFSDVMCVWRAVSDGGDTISTTISIITRKRVANYILLPTTTYYYYYSPHSSTLCHPHPHPLPFTARPPSRFILDPLQSAFTSSPALSTQKFSLFDNTATTGDVEGLQCLYIRLVITISIFVIEG